ncbi:hypothetical protein Fcan01_14333 [Folsomia candida]|uniref:Uncharacterized protein n=1 Tax=Folsomia candida TaxID=158441 RepID=A0A226E1X6_FOLCA|nr:hypothetical protein Fcan01_14333 [Folsomia candida]
MNHTHGGDDPLLRCGEVFSHYKPVKGQENNSVPLQEIELQLISSKNSRVLFYNNNNNGCHFSAGGQGQGQHPGVKYHLEDAFLPGENGDGDYSECAEFDLTRCCCEGGGGRCGGECGGGVTSGGGSSDPETFYESVLLPGGRPQVGVGSGSGGNLGTRNQFELQTHGRDCNSGNSGKLQSFRNQLRDQVRQDGINFSRVSQFFYDYLRIWK